MTDICSSFVQLFSVWVSFWLWPRFYPFEFSESLFEPWNLLVMTWDLLILNLVILYLNLWTFWSWLRFTGNSIEFSDSLFESMNPFSHDRHLLLLNLGSQCLIHGNFQSWLWFTSFELSESMFESVNLLVIQSCIQWATSRYKNSTKVEKLWRNTNTRSNQKLQSSH